MANDFASHRRHVREIMRRDVERTGKRIEQEVQSLLSTQGGTAAPGESPHYHTSEYRESFKGGIIETEHSISYQYGTDHPAALSLEFGDSIHSPHPHMRPGVARAIK